MANFEFFQVIEKERGCELQFTISPLDSSVVDVNFSASTNLTCPEASQSGLLIRIETADENSIYLDGDTLYLRFRSTGYLISESLILRDMLVPNLLSDLKAVSFY